MTSWKTYKLGEIADIQTGPFGSQLHNKDYATIGSPIVTVEHLGNRRFTTQNLPLVSDTDKARLSKYVLSEGDIVFSRVGSVDRCSYVSKAEDGWMFSGRCLRVRCSSKAYPLYVYYYFCLESIKQYIRNVAVGATMPSINTQIMSEIPISLPSLEEQRRIAGILGAIDDKIENNRRINANLESQAQALYKQWFVDNRSDDWEVGAVSDYYDITIGKTPPRKEKQWFSINPKDSIWVSISDMGSCGAYISESSEFLTAEAVDKFNIKVVPNNTVLLSFKLTVGRVAISDGVMTTNEAIAHFNTSNDYLTEYTYLALKAYNFANLGSTSSIATAVNSKIIKSMPWVMPNQDILSQFHALASPIFKQIKNNIKENKTLATLRDTLLPKLMNGEIKL